MVNFKEDENLKNTESFMCTFDGTGCKASLS